MRHAREVVREVAHGFALKTVRDVLGKWVRSGGGFLNFAILRHLLDRGQIFAQEKLFEFSKCVLCETSKKGQKVKGNKDVKRKRCIKRIG